MPNDIRATLAAMKERADAATEGPWTPMEFDDDPHDWGVAILGGGERGTMDAHLTAYTMTMNNVEQSELDAEFIAAARTEQPALVDALTAVLDLHRPVDIEPSETICHECSTIASLPGEGLWYSEADDYPCPTVRAITEKLEGL